MGFVCLFVCLFRGISFKVVTSGTPRRTDQRTAPTPRPVARQLVHRAAVPTQRAASLRHMPPGRAPNGPIVFVCSACLGSRWPGPDPEHAWAPAVGLPHLPIAGAPAIVQGVERLELHVVPCRKRVALRCARERCTGPQAHRVERLELAGLQRIERQRRHSPLGLRRRRSVPRAASEEEWICMLQPCPGPPWPNQCSSALPYTLQSGSVDRRGSPCTMLYTSS